MEFDVHLWQSVLKTTVCCKAYYDIDLFFFLVCHTPVSSTNKNWLPWYKIEILLKAVLNIHNIIKFNLVYKQKQNLKLEVKLLIVSVKSHHSVLRKGEKWT